MAMNSRSARPTRRAIALSRPPAPPALDIGLVRALVALVNESSVSRAAESLSQSQPQMSATLRRLRALLDDPILVRGSRGMVPTEHALGLLATARRVLGDMRALLAQPPRFDPLTTTRAMRLAIPDFISAALLAAIVGRIRSAAQASSVVVGTVRSEADGMELLESGRADVLIESEAIASASVRDAPLFDDAILGVAASRHPLFREELSVEGYLGLPHVAAAPASGTRPGMIDRMLAARGYTRRVVAWVPYLNTLPLVLERSDLVFTTSAHLARAFTRQAGLKVFAPPVRFPRIRYHLMWHDRVHRAAEHRWLRSLIREAVAAELAA